MTTFVIEVYRPGARSAEETFGHVRMLARAFPAELLIDVDLEMDAFDPGAVWHTVRIAGVAPAVIGPMVDWLNGSPGLVLCSRQP